MSDTFDAANARAEIERLSLEQRLRSLERSKRDAEDWERDRARDRWLKRFYLPIIGACAFSIGGAAVVLVYSLLRLAERGCR